MTAFEPRFPRRWRQRCLLVPLPHLVELWFRPRLHGLEHVPLDRLDREGRVGFARAVAAATQALLDRGVAERRGGRAA